MARKDPAANQPQPDPAQPIPDAASPEDRAAGVVIGGPGEPIQAAPAGSPVTSQGVEFVIGGRKFSGDPALAQAIQAREQEFSRKLSENSQELGEWRTGKRALQTQPTPQPTQTVQPQAEDLGTLIFTDPQRALAMHEQQIMAKIAQAYQQDVNQRQFWTDFYREATDLDPMQDDALVKVTMQKNYAELNALPVSMARSRLADLTRNEILRYTQKQQPTTNPGGVRIESASPTTAQPAQQPQPTPHVTLSQMVKNRRAVRLGLPAAQPQ